MTKPTRPDAKHASVTTNTAQWRETGKTRRKAKLNKNEAKPTKCGAKLTRTSGAKLKTTSPMPSCELHWLAIRAKNIERPRMA